MKKIKLVASGGFGDALYVFGYLLQRYSKEEVFLTHVRKDTLPINDSIEEFYTSQGIESKVIVVPSLDNWIKEECSKGTFEEILNIIIPLFEGMEDYPDIQYTKLSDVPKTVLAPRGGRDERTRREFSVDDVNKFLEINKEEELLLLGNTDKNYVDSLVLYPKHVNLMNKTSVQDLLNLVGSSSKLYGLPGFATYLAAMTKSKVYSTIEHHCSHMYFNPVWDVTFINSLCDK